MYHSFIPLRGEADPDIDYFSAIYRFASERLEKMTSKAVWVMQRRRPLGAFPDRPRIKTFWDELCWFWEQADHLDSSEWPFEHVLEKVVGDLTLDLPDSDAVFISCAASEDQQFMPCRDNGEIARALRESIRERAADRDKTPLEQVR